MLEVEIDQSTKYGIGLCSERIENNYLWDLKENVEFVRKI
jgi:hypothetical protein